MDLGDIARQRLNQYHVAMSNGEEPRAAEIVGWLAGFIADVVEMVIFECAEELPDGRTILCSHGVHSWANVIRRLADLGIVTVAEQHGGTVIARFTA